MARFLWLFERELRSAWCCDFPGSSYISGGRLHATMLQSKGHESGLGMAGRHAGYDS